jgi:hypothetical protein
MPAFRVLFGTRQIVKTSQTCCFQRHKRTVGTKNVGLQLKQAYSTVIIIKMSKSINDGKSILQQLQSLLSITVLVVLYYGEFTRVLNLNDDSSAFPSLNGFLRPLNTVNRVR